MDGVTASVAPGNSLDDRDASRQAASLWDGRVLDPLTWHAAGPLSVRPAGSAAGSLSPRAHRRRSRAHQAGRASSGGGEHRGASRDGRASSRRPPRVQVHVVELQIGNSDVLALSALSLSLSLSLPLSLNDSPSLPPSLYSLPAWLLQSTSQHLLFSRAPTRRPPLSTTRPSDSSLRMQPRRTSWHIRSLSASRLTGRGRPTKRAPIALPRWRPCRRRLPEGPLSTIRTWCVESEARNRGRTFTVHESRSGRRLASLSPSAGLLAAATGHRLPRPRFATPFKCTCCSAGSKGTIS